MREDNISTKELGNLEEHNQRYFQIDLLKAVMIFLVLFDHTFPWELKSFMGVQIWERISIPMFLVIMGFNMGLSFKKTGETSLTKLYSWKYFKKKFWRFIFPFLVLYTISTIIGLSIYNFDFESMWYGQHYDSIYGYWRWDMSHLLIGILPFYGPGNWFLPVVFWSILIMPLIYKGFSGTTKWSTISLILCYIVELSIQLVIFFIVRPYVPNWRIIYAFIVTTPLFMLSAIGLGMWFSRDHDLFSKKNMFMWVLFPLSLIYLIAYQFFDFDFAFIGGDYHLFAFPYSAFLFLIVMKLIPKSVNDNNLFVKGIKMISKATFHILLTQMFYFGIVISIWGHFYGASILGIDLSYDTLVVFLYFMVNWMICIPMGVLWWYGENRVRQYRYSRKILKSNN
jgi:hypothetical protein